MLSSVIPAYPVTVQGFDDTLSTAMITACSPVSGDSRGPCRIPRAAAGHGCAAPALGTDDADEGETGTRGEDMLGCADEDWVDIREGGAAGLDEQAAIAAEQSTTSGKHRQDPIVDITAPPRACSSQLPDTFEALLVARRIGGSFMSGQHHWALLPRLDQVTYRGAQRR